MMQNIGDKLWALSTAIIICLCWAFIAFFLYRAQQATTLKVAKEDSTRLSQETQAVKKKERIASLDSLQRPLPRLSQDIELPWLVHMDGKWFRRVSRKDPKRVKGIRHTRYIYWGEDRRSNVVLKVITKRKSLHDSTWLEISLNQ